MDQNTREELKRIAAVRGEACVTITLNTHRTAPDYLKDPILLKNLLKEAETRLVDEYGKKTAEVVMAKLNALADGIDHAHNLEGLVLYANTEISGLAKLPVTVVDRVSLDDHFTTRDLVRAMQQGSEYYILWLNRNSARLVRAFNNQVVEEVKGEFPQKNHVASHDTAKQVADRDFGALIKEYFNRVDKALVKVLNDHPLPVVLATESRNVEHYRAVADRKAFLKGNFNPTHDDLAVHHLVEEAWKAYGPVVQSRYNERVKVLDAAVSAGKLHSEHHDVWQAINEGRGDTLFVKEGLFQPAMIVDERIELLPAEERERHGAVDDILNEMAQRNLAHGGDAVFVSGDELDRFNGLALVTRY